MNLLTEMMSTKGCLLKIHAHSFPLCLFWTSRIRSMSKGVSCRRVVYREMQGSLMVSLLAHILDIAGAWLARDGGGWVGGRARVWEGGRVGGCACGNCWTFFCNVFCSALSDGRLFLPVLADWQSQLHARRHVML